MVMYVDIGKRNLLPNPEKIHTLRKVVIILFYSCLVLNSFNIYFNVTERVGLNVNNKLF